MIQVQIASHFDVRAADGRQLEAVQIHGEGERLMQALLDLEKCNPDISDSATASDADRGTIVVELLVTAESETAAFAKALTVCRTAIHAIGGATPSSSTRDPSADYRPRDVQLEYV